MEVRRLLHERPAVTVVGCVVLVAIAGYFAYERTRPPKPAVPPWSGNVWYTDDDGKTWSANAPGKITPFTDSAGKTWVRAHVFAGKDGKPFCGYIEMFPPAARQRIGEPQTSLELVEVMEAYGPTLVVKRPGDADWVPKRGAEAITDVMVPGTQERAKEVLPK
jgi:hypothetical protein